MTLLVVLGCVGGAGESDTDRPVDSGSTPTETGAEDSADASGDSADTTPPLDDTAATTDSHDSGGGDTGSGVPWVTDADFILVGSDPFSVSPIWPVAADWNGDGTQDLAVSLPLGTTDHGARDGVAYRLTDLTLGRVELGTVSERFLGTGESAGIGLFAGFDVDGDGYDDAVLYENGADYSGHLSVMPGPFNGDVVIGEGVLSFYGAAAGDYFGDYSAAIGYLTSDGERSLAISTVVFPIGSERFEHGAVALYPSTATGVQAPDQASAWVGCANDDACTGFAGTTHVVDANGDGVDDLWISAYYSHEYTGTVYLFDGPFGGERLETDADANRVGPIGGQYGYQFGPCDFDGDGTVDLAAWAGSDDSFAENGGAVYVESGPIAGSGEATRLSQTILYGSTEQRFGFPNWGDLDGDGRCDLLATVQDSTYRGDLYRWSSLPGGQSEYTTGEVIVRGGGEWDSAAPSGLPDLDGDALPDPVLYFYEEDQGAMGVFLSGELE